MPGKHEIVVTGLGLVSPLGIGQEAFWRSLLAGESGAGPITLIDHAALPMHFAAEVHQFDPAAFVKPRKSIKVMARDAQLAITAAALARDDAGLTTTGVDPERLGVVLGADKINQTVSETEPSFRAASTDGHFRFDLWCTRGLEGSYPLGMLRLLPNMLACHISIAQDARGPNNTLCMVEASSLLAVGEAAAAIERGWVDVMLAGGASSRMQAYDWVHDCALRELSRRNDNPAAASRPFDAQRDGEVRGEGAAVLVLEERRHAERRGAKVLCRVLNWASGCDVRVGGARQPGSGLRRAVQVALDQAGLTPGEIGHVNAHAAGTQALDALEANMLAELLPGVPVTAPKSAFGQLFAAGGAMELAASALALHHDRVPATLNYQRPDPAGPPLPIIAGEPLVGARPYALALNLTELGQAAVVVLGPA